MIISSQENRLMRKERVVEWSELEDRKPFALLVQNVDLVVVRYDNKVSVLYGRCLHRGAMLADGSIKGNNLVCGVHSWDFRFDTGVSEYDNKEKLEKFTAFIEDGGVWVDLDEIAEWCGKNPQPYQRDAYLGQYADPHGTPEEPYTALIKSLSEKGVKEGEHGPLTAMGVALTSLPLWNDIQIVTAQLARLPLLDNEHITTEVVIGPNAKRPLRLKIPLMVSDMSFGALSEEAKIALAKGAEIAGTGICSGEGGMLPEEREENSRYFYELASGRFGFSMEKVKQCQAFHFKGGQGAKTGTGGHLPGEKVMGKIAGVRGLTEGQPAISPSRFPDWTELSQIRDFATEVREATGGIPVGYKLSAQRIEEDIDAALEVGVDYIILDGRGGGTGAAPSIFRDHISVPTIPALARARRHLDRAEQKDVTLVITGGLRTPTDFFKAIALGADAIALSTVAMHSIGCIAMRACNTNNCPVGIATQNRDLRSRLSIDHSAQRLARFLESATELIKVLVRACGHRNVANLSTNDLVTWSREMSDLSGVPFAGIR